MATNELYLMENPRRRRRRRRNPDLTRTMKGWTQGLGIREVGAAAAGLVAALLVPAYFIKPATGSTLTTSQKWMRTGLAVACAIGAGFIGDALKLGPRAGQFAVAGGLAGATAQAIGSFTNFNTGVSRRVSRIPALNRPARTPIGRYPAPAFTPEFQGVTLD